MTKKLLIITAILIAIGGCSSTMEKIERMDVTDAAMGCGLSYAEAEALTTYGIIGIKVWIYKGDIDDNAPHEMENNPNKLG